MGGLLLCLPYPPDRRQREPCRPRHDLHRRIPARPLPRTLKSWTPPRLPVSTPVWWRISPTNAGASWPGTFRLMASPSPREKTTDQILADPTSMQNAARSWTRSSPRPTLSATPSKKGYAVPPRAHLPDGDPTKPSTLVDWLAGNELEIEPIWGDPCAMRNAPGLPCRIWKASRFSMPHSSSHARRESS